MAKTSGKRGEILAFLRAFTDENGYPPTVREIMQAVGLKSTATVHYHLSELDRAGEISVSGSKNRAISVPRQSGVPVIGVVTAGQPILAVENIEGYLPYDGGEDYRLFYRGDALRSIEDERLYFPHLSHA